MGARFRCLTRTCQGELLMSPTNIVLLLEGKEENGL